MKPCGACDFEYDHRKTACPQCGEARETKSALEGEGEPVEPASPSIDRQDILQKQIDLAQEKQKLLKQKQELRKLEDRLAEINTQNADLEKEIGAQPATEPAQQQPAGTLQDGGASGLHVNTARTPVFLQNAGQPGIPAPPGFQARQPQLFYADGSPFQTGDDSSLAASTLQAGLQSVGLGLQALGLAGDSTGGVNHAGEQGLFSNLRRKRARHWIRPDFHLPYDKMFDEMTYRELMYGMICVLESVHAANDARFSLKGYIDHFKYIALKEIRPTYVAKAVAKYEHDVTTKVVEGRIAFHAAEHTSNATHFGIENTRAYVEAMRLLQGGKPTTGQGSGNRSGSGGSAPRIWCPDDICASWNFTNCHYNPCHKSHICCVCRGSHRAKGGCSHGSQQQQGQQYQQQQQHQYQAQQQYNPYQQQQPQYRGQPGGGQRPT